MKNNHHPSHFFLQDFPFKLCGFLTAQDFCEAHQSNAVPLLLMRKDMGSIRWIAETVKGDLQSIFMTCTGEQTMLRTFLPTWKLPESV